jgi:hypothetical protein
LCAAAFALYGEEFCEFLLQSGKIDVTIVFAMDRRKFCTTFAGATHSHFFRHPTHQSDSPFQEARMSKPSSSVAPKIPVGILVSDAPKPPRPAPRAAVKRTSAPERAVPWLCIAVGGTMLWVLIVAVVGVFNLVLDRPQPEPTTLATNPPVVAPVVLPAPLPRPEEFPGEEPPIEPAPAPGIREPILLRPIRQPFIEDVALPVEVIPEPQAPPPVPAPPAPPLKRPRKLVDTKVYANCDDVGTDILFMKDPIAAFQRAKAEKKQVFMVHLSGNLEDPGCT